MARMKAICSMRFSHFLTILAFQTLVYQVTLIIGNPMYDAILEERTMNALEDAAASSFLFWLLIFILAVVSGMVILISFLLTVGLYLLAIVYTLKPYVGGVEKKTGMSAASRKKGDSGPSPIDLYDGGY